MKHWQCDSEAQSMEDEPWRNEEATTGVGRDGFHPRVPLDKRHAKSSSEVSREG